MPVPDFVSFDKDRMPTNSDVLFVVAQYLAAMNKFKRDNTGYDGIGDFRWKVSGGKLGPAAIPPKRH